MLWGWIYSASNPIDQIWFVTSFQNFSSACCRGRRKLFVQVILPFQLRFFVPQLEVKKKKQGAGLANCIFHRHLLMSQEWSRSIIGRYCTYLHNLTTPSSPRKRQLGSEKLMRGLILPWLEEEANIVLAGINLMCKLKEETYIVLAGIALSSITSPLLICRRH